jgi:hypothetical protein
MTSVMTSLGVTRRLDAERGVTSEGSAAGANGENNAGHTKSAKTARKLEPIKQFS